MNDDELKRQLRDPVPPPAPGYWESIDSMLWSVEAEPQNGDTEPGVSRPKGMSTYSPTPSRPSASAVRVRWLAAASVAAVAVGTVVALGPLRGSRVDTGPPAVSPPPVAGSSTPSVGSTASTTPATLSPAASSSPAVGSRRCFAGGELGGTAVIRFDVDREGLVSATRRGGTKPAYTFEAASGYLLDDTRAVVKVAAPGVASRAELWLLSASSITLAEDVTVAAVSCSSVSAEVAQMDAATAGVKLPTGEPTPALSPGRYCYFDKANSPGADYVRLDVSAGGSVSAETRTADSAGTVAEKASGQFVTANDLLVDTTITKGASPATRTEIWRLTQQGLTMNSILPAVQKVDCATINSQFGK